MNTIPRCKVLCVIDVKLGEQQPVGILVRQGFEVGHQSLTPRTPRCPKVYDDRKI